MTEIEAQRLTYISKDGLVCYKDHKSPNVISAYDIKATHSLDEACTIIDILLRRLAEHEAIGTVEQIRFMKSVCDMSDDMLKSIADSVRARRKYEAIGTVEELQTLKDAEEQGLLLRLPCKMNDEVWAIRSYRGVTYPQKGFVNEMFFTKDMRLVIVVKNIARGEFGKKVFLTKEEAEQALKQMKGEQNG